jgi:hypothetical protein
MKNNETNKSKGYGFIEFKDYIEFKHALDNTEPLILRKKKLIFNSARNKYDNYNNPFYAYNIKNNNDNKNFYNKYNDYNFYKVNKENINNNIINPIYKERKNKFELVNKVVNPEIKEKENIKNCSLNEQIKYSLKNLSKNYSKNDNFLKSKICVYYCTPFLDKNIYGINKNSLTEK